MEDPESSSDLMENSLDQIKPEADAKAIILLMATDLDEKDGDNNQPPENEKLKMTTIVSEPEAIEQLVDIYLDETEDNMEKHLGDETFKAILTEAEVEADKELFINNIEAESLDDKRCEVMSASDTEPKVSTHSIQSDLDETPNDQPLGHEVQRVLDAEAGADDLNRVIAIFLDETETCCDQLLSIQSMNMMDEKTEAEVIEQLLHFNLENTEPK
ncbi:hypothetical protein SRHO_G00157130 [Serrasalmus rhombeus]